MGQVKNFLDKHITVIILSLHKYQILLFRHSYPSVLFVMCQLADGMYPGNQVKDLKHDIGVQTANNHFVLFLKIPHPCCFFVWFDVLRPSQQLW